SSRRRHTRSKRDWSSDVCSSDLFKVCGVQAHEVHSAWLEESRDEYGPALRELLDLGRSVSGREYQELILRRIEYSGRVYQSLQRSEERREGKAGSTREELEGDRD